jgi:hypothetical protein
MQILADVAGVPYGIVVFLVGIPLLYLAFTIWMLFYAIRNEPPGSKERIIWPLLIVIFGGLPAFFYNISRRKQRIKLYGK